MALNKRYELIPRDSDSRVFLAIQDHSAHRQDASDDGSIELTLKDDDGGQPDESFDSLSVWLTREEAHELRSVLSVMLGVATAADDAVAD